MLCSAGAKGGVVRSAWSCRKVAKKNQDVSCAAGVEGLFVLRIS